MIRDRLLCAAIFWIAFFTATASAQDPPTQIAPGVYARLGRNGEISAAAGGDIGNQGFVVGRRGVVVVDTGVSRKSGDELLGQIAAVTRKPVRAAILTHAAQEFIFGAAAFEAHGIPLLAHRETAALMHQRCQTCLKRLTALLGEEALSGTRLVVPTRLVDGSTRLALAGRDLRLLHYGWAATPGDLAVFEARSGVLFAGGLVEARRIPDLRDARLDGWVAALEALRKLPIRHLVPGHGPIGGKEEIDRMLDYLRQLDAAVRERYSAGASLLESMKTVELPAFVTWQNYATAQPQNVQYLYQALETAELAPAPP